MSTHHLFGRSSLTNHNNNQWFDECSGRFPREILRDDSYIAFSRQESMPATSYFLSNEEIQLAIVGSPHGIGDFDNDQIFESEKFVRAFIKNGSDVLSSIGGRFALAAYLHRDNELILAVDRYSIENLYYVIQDNELCFSNSAASLASHHSVGNQYSLQAIYNYLYFHCVPGPDCGYNKMTRLLPSHYISVKDNQVTIKEYWQPIYEPEQDKVSSELLQATLGKAVKKRMPNKPIACFLSGGLDSSTLTGYCHQTRQENTIAVTIGFDEKKYDETEFAAAVAKHYGIKHETYNVTPDDIVGSITNICASFDTPFGNASAVPTYFCAKLAKELGYEHMLAGDGGDELFGGNSRYSKELVFDIYHRIPTFARNKILEPFISLSQNIVPNPLTRKAQSYIDQANIPLPARTQTYNLLNRVSCEDFLSLEFLHSVDTDAPIHLLEQFYFKEPVPTNIINRMLRLDRQFILADNDLVKVSKMCELAGTNVEFPLLDESVFSLAAKLPPQDLVTRNSLRPFFRNTFSHMLPNSTLNKSKHGFGLPFGIWLAKSNILQELAFDSIEYLAREKIIKNALVVDFFREKLNENADYYGVLIWVLMCLSLWLQSRNTKLV